MNEIQVSGTQRLAWDFVKASAIPCQVSPPVTPGFSKTWLLSS